MAGEAKILLQYNQPVTQQSYNDFVSGKPTNFNGHIVRILDGDTINVDNAPRNIRLSGGDSYEVERHSRQTTSGVQISSPEENRLGDKARHIAARMLLSNNVLLSAPTGESRNRDIKSATVIDPNKTLKPFNILDPQLSGGYATPAFLKNEVNNNLEELRRQNILAGGKDGSAVVRKFMPNLSSDQYRNRFNELTSSKTNLAVVGGSHEVISNIENRNPRIASIANASFIKSTQQEIDTARYNYEYHTSLNKLGIGAMQIVNKAIGKGIIGSLLRSGDEPTAASRLADSANEAYIQNEKILDDTRQYRNKIGIGTGALTASEIAPEIASELATAIPIAGQIGKISAIANLANKGKLGAIAAEGLKWGGAEVPASYLLGNQDHLGERVAMGAAGGVVGEGLIQGGKALFKKAGELKEKIPVGKTSEDVKAGEYEPRVNTPEMTPEASTINEVPKVDTNTPEIPVVEKKPVSEPNKYVVTTETGTTNSEFMKKLNSGGFDNLGEEKLINLLESKLSKISGDAGLFQSKKMKDFRKTVNEEAYALAARMNKLGIKHESVDELVGNLKYDYDMYYDEFLRSFQKNTPEEVGKYYSNMFKADSNVKQAFDDAVSEFRKSSTPKAEPEINTADGSGGATAPQAEVKSLDIEDFMDTKQPPMQIREQLAKVEAKKAFEDAVSNDIKTYQQYVSDFTNIDNILNNNGDVIAHDIHIEKELKKLFKNYSKESESLTEDIKKLHDIKDVSLFDKTKSSFIDIYKDLNSPADFLKIIKSDKTVNKEQRLLASKLYSLSKQYSDIKVDKTFSANDSSAAVFDRLSRTIRFGEYIDNHIVMHEIAHSVTVDFLGVAEDMIKRGISNDFTASYKRLNSIMEQTKQLLYIENKFTNSGTYGFNNIYEFVAEAFSNQEFQAMLKSVELKNSSVTIWDKFVKVLKSIFKIEHDNDALSEVLSISSRSSKDMSKNARELIRTDNSLALKKKLTTKEINKGIADIIDMGTDHVVGSVKKMLEEPHIKSLVDSGLDIGKAARDTISKTLDKSKFGRDFKERFSMEGESIESIFKNLTSDIDTTLRGQMFNKMIAVGKKGETESIQVGDFIRANSKQLMKDMPEGGEPLRKAFTKHYLHTDFQAIDKIVKSFDDVVNYLKENRSLYNQFKKEIDQAALALKDRGAMNSKHYYNNAEAIAKTKGIKDPDIIEKIDKLISMKALTKEDLDFILANRNQSWFNDLAEKAQEASNLSKSLFEKDPHNYMKGYYKEVYGKDLYSHEFDITGKDTKTWKFLERPEYVKGALPVNAVKKPIGAEVTTAKALNSADASTRAEALDALRSAGKVRVVRDAQGKPLSYHKVLNEERRATELNKNYDAADILASTYQSILKKHGVNDLVKYIKEETGDTFISYKPKEGFVRMPQSEAVLLPKELRGEFKDGKYEIYLPKDLKHQLIGNQAIGYTERASLLNGFHRFMNDASSHFKHNVIITSFRSYFVNELGGWTAALRQGMSIGEIRGYLKELSGQTKQMRQLQNQYFQALTSGKDVTKIEAKLRSIPLVQMRDEGLSLTMIHDYMAHSGNRSVSHDLAETGLEKLYKFLGKEKQHPLATKDVLQLEDGTYGGEVASLIMSNIDARWRYVITKGLMDKKGHSMTEAVNLANSIFGNANKITPRIVQYADNMLIMPFGSWMFRVLAGNIKANKDNMAQALGIYTTMKALSAGTGYNLNSGDSTQIPLSGVNSAKRMGFDNIFNAANPFHEPLYVNQLLKAGSSRNPLDAILTPNR